MVEEVDDVDEVEDDEVEDDKDYDGINQRIDRLSAQLMHGGDNVFRSDLN